MGQDLLLTLERITKQNGYKLKVYSCQNLKGIEVKVTMSENKPANLRQHAYTQFPREECSEFADLLF